MKANLQNTLLTGNNFIVINLRELTYLTINKSIKHKK